MKRIGWVDIPNIMITWLRVHCRCHTLEDIAWPLTAIMRAQPKYTDYDMMPSFFSVATNIPLIKNNLKLNWEKPHFALPCHQVGGRYRSHLRPGRKNAYGTFCGRQSIWIWTAPDLRHPAWRQRRWSCGVFEIWTSDVQCPIQRKGQVLNYYDLSLLQHVGVYFNEIAFSMKGWSLFQRDFMFWWREAPLLCQFQTCEVAAVNTQICIDFKSVTAFWWMLSSISWKYFTIHSIRLFIKYSKF